MLSRHTTTAVVINEAEPRLLDDIRLWLRRLAPPSDPYLHNDLHLRDAPDGWPGGWGAWAAQEPANAHSHLLSIALGNSECVPVAGGALALGTWQSVLLVELDGLSVVACCLFWLCCCLFVLLLFVRVGAFGCWSASLSLSLSKTSQHAFSRPLHPTHHTNPCRPRKRTVGVQIVGAARS